jgi:hypothetical protein
VPESKHRRKNKNRPRERHVTPPPAKRKPSPDWVPRLGVGLLGVGVLAIILGYVPPITEALRSLPGLGANWTLVGGFVLLVAGFVVLTRWE